MTKIEDYASEIPEEIRRAIRGLDSDYRAAIFVALYRRGEFSFSELQKELGISKAMLNYHLGKLIEGALVHHYYKHELGTEKYSFYNVTPFGQNFVEILSQFLKPQPFLVSLRETAWTSPDFIVARAIAAKQMGLYARAQFERMNEHVCPDYAGGPATSFSAHHLVWGANLSAYLSDISTHAEESTNVKKRLMQTPTV